MAKSPPKSQQYSERIAVGVTTEQRRRLEEILRARARAGQMTSLAEVLRAAVNLFIAQQDDIPGTRAAITRKLEGRFETFEARLGALEAQIAEQSRQLEALVAFFRKRQEGR
jgi:predicted component of type VI protein secretion system